MSLHSTLPLIATHHANGPVLRLTIWSAVNLAYFSHEPTNEIGPIRCTRETALFCLTEQSIYSPKLKRIAKSLKYVHNVDVNHNYVAIACKNPDPSLLELVSRSIATNGACSQVVGQHSCRILRAFVDQNPLDILKRAVQYAIPLGKVVVGRGDERHKRLALY